MEHKQELHVKKLLKTLQEDYGIEDPFKEYQSFLRAKYNREKGFQWPDWCLCPMAAGTAIISRGRTPDPFLLLKHPNILAVIAAIAAWRYTKGVYIFDRSLTEALIKTKLNDSLPLEILYKLPRWSSYVQLPENVIYNSMGNEIAGFYVHLEYDTKGGPSELRFLVDYRSGKELQPLILYIMQNGSISVGVDEMLKVSNERQKKFFGSHITDFLFGKVSDFTLNTINQLLPFVLYLCADNVEMPTPVTVPVLSNKMFPAKNITYNYLSLPEIDSVNQSQGKKPHIRRAHWHTYYAGPRSSKRKIILHWLSQIHVNNEEKTRK